MSPTDCVSPKDVIPKPGAGPNGAGLSPDGKTLYVGEIFTFCLMKSNITEPGKVAPDAGPGGPGIPVYRPAGHKFFDSPAIEESGNDMMDAWLCLSATGRLVKTRWKRPGMKLEYLNK
mgnify:CR=1 FL=1